MAAENRPPLDEVAMAIAVAAIPVQRSYQVRMLTGEDTIAVHQRFVEELSREIDALTAASQGQIAARPAEQTHLLEAAQDEARSLTERIGEHHLAAAEALTDDRE